MKRLASLAKEIFSDDEDPKKPHYDPVHIGMMVVFTIFALAVLFWLLWCLLVFGGGLQAKIIPAFQLATHTRTPADFGYIGYPYEMGVFSGWPTNVVALLILLAFVAGAWVLLNEPKKKGKTKHEDHVQR